MLDGLSRDVAFVSGLLAHRIPCVGAELGSDANPFILAGYGQHWPRL
jgi:hypothetical protein